MGILASLIYVIAAAACSFIADRLLPQAIPGGFLIGLMVGLFGAWIGGALMGHFGPELDGVALFPSVFGAASLVFLLANFFCKSVQEFD